MRFAAIALATLAWGCLDDPTVRCDDGTLCPAGTTCARVVGTTHCVGPEQRLACAGAGDGAACDLVATDDGVCNQGVCLRPGCGDGFLSVGEKCDGALVGDESCASRGYYQGELGCTAACDYDLSACRGTCGDGTIDGAAGEQCDGAAPPLTCAAGGFYGDGVVGCSPTCRYDFSGCTGGRCGDGVLDPGEDCEPTVPIGGDVTCGALGYYDATAAVGCNAICQYDVSACGGRCGDGAIDPEEDCEGDDLAGATCVGRGFYGGDLGCTATCRYDDTPCALVGRCGDGVRQAAHEACDVDDYGGQSCLTGGLFADGLPRYAGTLACTPSCAIDAAACAQHCGDGVINGPEACDGDRFQNDATCRSFGYQFGALSCDDGCTEIDTRTCSGRCGDGVLQGDEACDGSTHGVLEASCGALGEHGAMGCDSYCQLETYACEASEWIATNLSLGATAVSEVRAIWPAARGDVWAIASVGGGRALVRGDGERWWTVAALGAIQPTALHGDGLGTVWIGDDAGQVTERGPSGVTTTDVGDGEIRHLAYAGGTLFAVLHPATGPDRLRRRTGGGWVDEVLPAGLDDLRALRPLVSGHLLALGDAGGGDTLGERAPNGTWSSSTLPAGEYLGLWADDPAVVWAVGGDGGLATVAVRTAGTWSSSTLTETTPGVPVALAGTVVGVGGQADALWLAGSDAGRTWLAQYRATSGFLVTRFVGPYPPVLGLADSGRGELWLFGRGPLVARFDGPGLLTPHLPGSVTDPTSLAGRLAAANLRAVAVTATDVWISAPPAVGTGTPIRLARMRRGQPLDTRWSVEPIVNGSDSVRVVARTATDVWSFAGNGAAQRHDGTSWSAAASPVPGQPVVDARAIAGVVYAIAGGGVHRHTGVGGWSSLATPPGAVALIGGAGPTELWAAGATAVHRFDGATWTTVGLPSGLTRLTAVWVAGKDDVWLAGLELNGGVERGVLLHRGPRDLAFTRFAAVGQLPGELRGFWGSGPADLWAVGDRGQVVHYDGQRWVPIEPVSSFAFPASYRGIAGAGDGALWLVGDAGIALAQPAPLPPAAAAPCADAIPLYCDGGAQVGYGSIPVGGRAVYRLDPPYEASLAVAVRSDPGAGAVTVTRRGADAQGACAGAAATTSGGTDVVAPTAIVAGHVPVFLELTATGQASPLGYQLEVACTPTR